MELVELVELEVVELELLDEEELLVEDELLDEEELVEEDELVEVDSLLEEVELLDVLDDEELLEEDELVLEELVVPGGAVGGVPSLQPLVSTAANSTSAATGTKAFSGRMFIRELPRAGAGMGSSIQ